MKKYDPQAIEPKWQGVWADTNVYAAKDADKSREKYYYLMEFPYPSGDGLHVGHVLGFTALDIMARHKRMQGNNVLYPIGFDEFGLPTENYAIKHKIAPQVATDRNVANFRRQFKSLGISFDWNREVRTADPNYYKWTQWIFLRLLERGLAYQAELPINWCPFEKTGLANEEVVDGKHERCGTPVEKKLLKQWVLKITAYADRLVEDLKTVDYLDRIATQQINWIGRSEGAEITWELQGLEGASSPKLTRAIVMHGKDVTPNDKWYPWFKAEAEAAGLTCEVPALGADVDPRIEDWIAKLAALKPDEHTVLVGHSRGGMAILRWLEQASKDVKVGRIVLVATNDSNQPDKTAGNFFSGEPYDYAKIKQHCHDVVVIHSRDDEWVPFSNGETIAAGLGVEIVAFDDKNHFGKNTPQVPEILAATLAGNQPSVTVYTTRPDTLFGATFLVVSPEVANTWIQSGWKASDEAADYIDAALKASELSRQEESKVKTGVDTGIKAVHPLTGDLIPVWVADYVLGSYGTGAIMAVPAHDERDQEFAKAFSLPIVNVLNPVMVREDAKAHTQFKQHAKIVAIVENEKDEILTINWGPRFGGRLTIGGTVEGDESAEVTARREVTEETGYTDLELVAVGAETMSYKYFAFSKNEAHDTQVQFVHFRLAGHHQQALNHDASEQNKFQVEWVNRATAEREVIEPLHKYALDKFIGGKVFTGEAPLTNSGEFDGLSGIEAKRAIVKALFDKGAGKGATKYRLRDWIFSRQHYWGEPIPVVHCAKDGVVPVPVDQLPIELPKVDHYEPTDTGESPLAAITDWVNTECPKCGGPAQRETDTMPNWAGSSWYFLRYTDAQNPAEFASADNLKYWTPIDLYNGGMEHTTLHLLYSRFWHKFLFDEGLVPTSEPYARRRSHGMILGPDGQKMSKSKGNVINPDHVVEKYGADTIRLYEMFMGPFDEVKAWSEDHLNGVSRFLFRVWTWLDDMTNDATTLSASTGYETDLGAFTVETDRLVHKTLKKVHHDIEDMHFNTAVSAMMELVNYLTSAEVKRRLRQDNALGLKNRTIRALVLMLAPFTPHLAEEVWHENLGEQGSVHLAAWPKYDPELIKDDVVTIVVQVNGKLRGNLAVPADASDADVQAAAEADVNVARHLEGKTVIKTVVVPRRIVNFVVKDNQAA